MLYSRALCVLFIPIGIIIFFSTPLIINQVIKVGLRLKPNSFLADMWSKNPAPLFLNFYVFNWTNPEDLYSSGVKPKFEEIGPFTFRETKIKDNPTWNDNGSVTFRQYHTYTFDRERSAADLNISITTLNPVLTTLGHTVNVKNWSYWSRKGLQIALAQLKQHMTITVPFGHYIFYGYPDILVNLASNLPSSIAPKLPMNDKFSWFYGRNATSQPEGVFTMGTNSDQLGVLEKWNYSNHTRFYDGICGSVKGVSAGEMFPPSQYGHTISLFIPDMCRSVTLNFERQERIEGIAGRKYKAGTRFLDNGTLYPENKCLCPGVCLPSGVMNISSCKYNGPVFISLPHFNEADEYYLNRVEGLKPQISQHEFFYVIEPETGIPLKVAQRLQLNLFLRPTRSISLFENVPEVMFPVMWFQEDFQLPDYALTALKIFSYVPAILRMLGVILFSVGLILNRHIVRSSFQRFVEPSLPITSELRPIVKGKLQK